MVPSTNKGESFLMTKSYIIEEPFFFHCENVLSLKKKLSMES
jgi:hypothetical protein